MKSRGIRLGRSVESGEVIRYDGNGCITRIGPPRSGKGRDVLVPILLDVPISLICIDVEGELSAVTARKRKQNLRRKVRHGRGSQERQGYLTL